MVSTQGSLLRDSYLFSNAELTLAVEDCLQCHRTHPVSQENNKVLRPVPRRNVKQGRGSVVLLTYNIQGGAALVNFLLRIVKPAVLYR